MNSNKNNTLFYHGTKAELEIGELLIPGHQSNYHPEIKMNHIYFTELIDGAGLAAELSIILAGNNGTPHVYLVKPLGSFEDDPNVTDKKFPGNPTRSFRSEFPLEIVKGVNNWRRLSSDELLSWKEKLAKLRENPEAKIIN